MNNQDIAKALLHLTRDCDGAKAIDGIGFNKYDADFGRKLCLLCEQGKTLTDKQHLAAYFMLKKYAEQLKKARIVLPIREELEEWLKARPTEVKLEASKMPPGEIIGIDNLLGEPFSCTIIYSFDLKKNELVKQIGNECNNRPHFDGYSKGWVFTYPSMELVSKLVATFPDFRICENTKTWVQKHRAKQQEIAISNAQKKALLKEENERLICHLNLDEEIGNKIPLPHQKEGFKEMIYLRRAINAWDRGLGKTFVSLMLAKAFKEVLNYHIIILCPATLKEEWKREMELLQIGCEIYSLHHLAIPQPPEENFILIADEAHAFQDIKSMRTQAFLNLALSDYCQACYCLTGTPLKNGKPENLFPLLVATRHRLGSSKKYFYDRYVNNWTYGSTSQDQTGKVYLKELREILIQEERVLIYLTKKECLDLPPKTRVLCPIEPSKEAIKEYRQVFEQLQKRYKERIAKGEITSDGEALVELSHLRHAASRAKVEEGINLAIEVLQRGDQILLFGNFCDTQEKIAKLIGAEIINGNTPQKDRHKIVDRFQAGQTRALVCGFGAAGVGLTLTAADTVILLDRPWTPGDAVQAEDRIYRIGQYYPTTAIWVQAFAVDAKIDKVLQDKHRRIELVLAGREEQLIDRTTGKSIAKQILEELMQSSWDGKQSKSTKPKIIKVMKNRQAALAK